MMRGHRPGIVLLAVVLAFCWFTTGGALGKSTLDDFETDATATTTDHHDEKPKHDTTQHPDSPADDHQVHTDDSANHGKPSDDHQVHTEGAHHGGGHDSSRTSEANEDFSAAVVRLCVQGLGILGVNSWYRINPTGDVQTYLKPRHSGDQLLAFARVDTAYRSVARDIDCLDLRSELGYGPLGFQYNVSHFRESHPTDSLTVSEIYGLYRMSPSSKVEIDLGLGTMHVMGNGSTGMVSWTLPILIQSTDHFGVEFRPAWAERLNDYDLAMLYHTRHLSLKAGYRWMITPHDSLNGPYAGVSMGL